MPRYLSLDDLRICTLSPANSVKTCAPLPARSTSVIARLLQLALNIFDGVCQTPAFHPARDFQAIVYNATSLVLDPAHATLHTSHEVDNAAMQSLLDEMNDSGLEWLGSLLDCGTNITETWEPEDIQGF
jgi:hypothetical protein